MHTHYLVQFPAPGPALNGFHQGYHSPPMPANDSLLLQSPDHIHLSPPEGLSPGHSGSFSLPHTPARSVLLDTGSSWQPPFGMQDVEEVLSREFHDGEC